MPGRNGRSRPACMNGIVAIATIGSHPIHTRRGTAQRAASKKPSATGQTPTGRRDPRSSDTLRPCHETANCGRVRIPAGTVSVKTVRVFFLASFLELLFSFCKGNSKHLYNPKTLPACKDRVYNQFNNFVSARPQSRVRQNKCSARQSCSLTSFGVGEHVQLFRGPRNYELSKFIVSWPFLFPVRRDHAPNPNPQTAPAPARFPARYCCIDRDDRQPDRDLHPPA